MSAMPAWAMISVASGLRSTSAGQARGDRRQPAAAVDQDRHPPLGREREHGPEPLVGRIEALRARMELDPARARVEAARASSIGVSFEVEPDEGDQPALRARGEGERAVVGGPEGRVAIGLVEAEHEGARDAVARHQLLELRRSRRPSRRCRCRGGGGRRRSRRPSGTTLRASSS